MLGDIDAGEQVQIPAAVMLQSSFVKQRRWFGMGSIGGDQAE